MSNLFSIQERNTLNLRHCNILYRLFHISQIPSLKQSLDTKVFIFSSSVLLSLTFFFSKLWQNAEFTLWKTEEGDDDRYKKYSMHAWCWNVLSPCGIPSGSYHLESAAFFINTSFSALMLYLFWLALQNKRT